MDDTAAAREGRILAFIIRYRASATIIQKETDPGADVALENAVLRGEPDPLGALAHVHAKTYVELAETTANRIARGDAPLSSRSTGEPERLHVNQNSRPIGSVSDSA